MADYVRVFPDGSAVEYSRSQLKFENPKRLFAKPLDAETLAEFNLFPLVEESRPSYNPNTQRLVRNDPQEINGTWTITWTVENLTQAEIDAQVQEDVARAVGVSDAEKALGLVMADIWLNITTGKNPPGVGPLQNQATQEEMQTARTQVRNRIKTYIRNLKGL